jgi:hypothetical protein
VPYNISLPKIWHHQAMSARPRLIAKLRVGSIVSGECSLCHEVIVVQAPGARTSDQQDSDQANDALEQAFEAHTHASKAASRNL